MRDETEKLAIEALRQEKTYPYPQLILDRLKTVNTEFGLIDKAPLATFENLATKYKSLFREGTKEFIAHLSKIVEWRIFMNWKFKLQAQVKRYKSRKTGKVKEYPTIRLSLPEEIVRKYHLKGAETVKIVEEQLGKLVVFLPTKNIKPEE